MKIDYNSKLKNINMLAFIILQIIFVAFVCLKEIILHDPHTILSLTDVLQLFLICLNTFYFYSFLIFIIIGIKCILML